jgi:prophage regulatory protein
MVKALADAAAAAIGGVAGKALADAAAAAIGGVAGISREFYSAAELEQITGIPESTWYYYAFAKKGPPSHKLGRRRVWPVAEFRIWLSEQRATGA